MRKLYLCLAFAFALLVQPAAAHADSTYKEFVQAWTERDARYVEEHDKLDKVAREAIAKFLRTPSSQQETESAIEAIKAASYVDGRGAMLRDLRIAMEKKPSNGKIELWLQDRMETLRRDSEALQARFDALRVKREGGEATGDSYFQEAVNAITAAATLRGKAEELRLIEQNLSSYVRAQGDEDLQRREARARMFGAISAALSGAASTPPPIQQGWTTRCDTYGAQTQCRTQ